MSAKMTVPRVVRKDRESEAENFSIFTPTTKSTTKCKPLHEPTKNSTINWKKSSPTKWVTWQVISKIGPVNQTSSSRSIPGIVAKATIRAAAANPSGHRGKGEKQGNFKQ